MNPVDLLLDSCVWGQSIKVVFFIEVKNNSLELNKTKQSKTGSEKNKNSLDQQTPHPNKNTGFCTTKQTKTVKTAFYL